MTLTIPKGANTGTGGCGSRGRGLADSHGRRGDLFARLVVTLPDTPDANLEGFAEIWKRERPYVPKRRT